MAKRSQLPKSGGKQAQSKGTTSKPVALWVVLAAVVGAVLLVLVGIVLLQAQSTRKPVALSGSVGEGTSWGPQDAKVKIIDYSDFQCSHCRNFALKQGKQLRQEYEATGSVRFEYKHFIINPPDSANAANASECAADQGRFWDYHDLLFSQQGVSRNAYTKAALKQYATQLGLDSAKFDQCVDGDQHLEKVYRDASDGQGAGVEGTPTFIINGHKLVGDVPYSEFKSAVDVALAGVPSAPAARTPVGG